jgi:hypothetical protein
LTRGWDKAASASMSRLVRNAARQGMIEVFAAQPYTRSTTPRYGSTARSGSRLFETEEIVSSGPEARWASSNAHRPGADPLCRCATRPQGRGASGMCGSAPAVRQRGSPKKGGSQRAGSVGGGESPTLGNRTLRTGTWIARWLQKSVRSISFAVLSGARKGARTAADKRGAAAAS